ncbi:uncharacterized protein VB005_08379 [Metarhizium brunneum]
MADNMEMSARDPPSEAEVMLGAQANVGDGQVVAAQQGTHGLAGNQGQVPRPRASFCISNRPSKGLCGNFNGWKTLSIASQASEVFQWIAAAPAHSQEAEHPGELKLLQVEGRSHLVRQMQSGDVVAFGQLAIDRQPTPEMTARKHEWSAAVLRRTQVILMRRPQRATVEHSCVFCNAVNQDAPSPCWLYDRVQHRTILVSKECVDGVPPYEVVSYTWGRAASNEWEEVAGVPWRVRSSNGLPVTSILDMLESLEERYIWIDIFCIPQECPSAKAREIARQAEIFRGARRGTAWLHQTAAVWPLVLGLISWSMYLRSQFSLEHPTPAPPPPGTLAALEELVSDPWFSSTWALQEAILRPNMSMIGVNEWRSSLIFPNSSLTGACFLERRITIDDFRRCLNTVRAIASVTIKCEIDRGPITTTLGRPQMRTKDALFMERLLQDTGLLGITTPTPAAILSGLAGRTSVKAHDKFYGIQSVFNLYMQGDYTRNLEHVKGEFLTNIWTKYAPILSLALNRPIIPSGSADFRSDTEDTLLWFSYSQINGGLMSCILPGQSAVCARFSADGLISLAASDSVGETGQKWRYEATAPPAAHSKVAYILFGLPPIPVSISSSVRMTELYESRARSWWHSLPILNLITRWWRHWQDRRGVAFFMDRTSRLLYVGQFFNENGHLGMKRNLHVYIEYYLKKPGVGHRVGAIVSETCFEHHRVDGSLIID